jgi:hypothetical protein
MNKHQFDSLKRALECAPASLRGEAWQALYNEVLGNGFVVTGLDAHGLVEHLSRAGELTKVMHEACSMYGFELVIDEDVTTRLRAEPVKCGKCDETIRPDHS